MRNKILIGILVVMAVAVLVVSLRVGKVAQQKTQLGPETTYADGARRVTIEELESMMKNDECVVIDVRNQAMFDAGHIPGAKLIPAGEIQNHLSELPRDKMIVTYCS